MTTVRSSPRPHAPAAALRTGCIVWTIERRAAIAALPDLPLDPRARKPLELRIAFHHDRTPTAELFDPASNRAFPIELVGPHITYLDAGPYTHIEITAHAETLLSATLTSTGESPRLLYARTSLLTRLHIKGGRYPAPSFARTT